MMTREKKVPAFLTVYLALTLGVMTSLFFVLMEGARLNTIQLEAACISDACMDSVMAEYHRELFRRYNLLAIDFSYGTKTASRRNLEGRLAWYLDLNMNHPMRDAGTTLLKSRARDLLGMQLESADLTGYSLLTDGNGSVFRRKAVEAIKDDYGVIAVQEALEWVKTVKEYHLDTRDVEEEKRVVDEQIAAWQGKEVSQDGKENAILEFDNPTVVMENHRKTGILWQTMGNKPLSGKRLSTSDLIYQRIKGGKQNLGNLPLSDQNTVEDAAEKVLFVEWLRAYLGCYGAPKEGSALEYELEYVLSGEESDAWNLRNVLYRLLALREASNATYLFSDETKREEADLVALALSTILGVPELEELFSTTILLGWAYAESIYDLSILMDDGRVPLMKTKETWHYGLSSFLEDLWSMGDASKAKEGLSYQDYLRILLLLEDETEMTCRAMDVVESDVRLTMGNQAFRLDGACTQIKTRIVITSKYGYRTELWEEKQY